MNWKKTVRRSIAILVILIVSVLSGLLYNAAWNRIDRSRYPQKYDDFVEKYASAYGVPEYIVYAVMKTESNFESNAVSDAGAVGLMQLTPDTFDWVSMLMKRSADRGMLYDPETSIEYGTYLLSYLYMHYNRWDTVLAAYNAGINRVDEWMQDPTLTDENGRLQTIPFEETAEYVKKVNNAIDVYRRLYY